MPKIYEKKEGFFNPKKQKKIDNMCKTECKAKV